MQDDFSSNNSRAIQIGKELTNQEIERLKADYDAALMVIHSLKSQIDELNEKIIFNEPLYSRRQLEAENARYRKALEYYANRMGMGGTARKALKGE